MDISSRPPQEPDSPQRQAIRSWERRRKLRPVYAAAGVFLLITAYAMRHMTGVGRVFCVVFALSGVILVGQSSFQARLTDCRCPICGHFVGSASRREFHCSICGFTHHDF